jgi:PDZ domain-containing secreted protein
VLVRVDGETVKTPDDVAAAIADNKPGDRVRVEYFRGNDRRTATVELARRPDRAGVPVEPQAPQSPDSPNGDGGGPFPLP